MIVEPTWYTLALKETGTAEIRGKEHNDRILEYHRSTNLHRRAAGKDETPWCSSFVNWCLEEAGWVGTDSAASGSWLTWGMELPVPWPGCIVVVRRRDGRADDNTGSRTGNHVAFYDSTPYHGAIRLFGGNQSDAVKATSFSLASYDVLGLRWPLERKRKAP